MMLGVTGAALYKVTELRTNRKYFNTCRNQQVMIDRDLAELYRTGRCHAFIGSKEPYSSRSEYSDYACICRNATLFAKQCSGYSAVQYSVSDSYIKSYNKNA